MRTPACLLVLALFGVAQGVGAQTAAELRACPALQPDTVDAAVIVRVLPPVHERAPVTFGAPVASAIAAALHLPDGLEPKPLQRGPSVEGWPTRLLGIQAVYDLTFDSTNGTVLRRSPEEAPSPLDSAVARAVGSLDARATVAPLMEEGWNRALGPLRLLVATSVDVLPGAAVVTRTRAARYVLERELRPAPGNKGPRYPAGLRHKNAEGQAILAFVIGPDGKARMESVRVVSASHEEFARASREALRDMRFEPAAAGVCAFTSEVTMPFTFGIGRAPAAAR